MCRFCDWVRESLIEDPGDLSVEAAEYERQAEAGDIYARMYVGWMHFAGHGVAKDVKRGIQHLTLAAEAGDPDAHYYLGGHARREGRLEAARAHYEAGHAAGYLPCTYWLGVLHWRYLGDPAKARVLLKEAMDQGHLLARAELAKLRMRDSRFLERMRGRLAFAGALVGALSFALRYGDDLDIHDPCVRD